MWGKSFIGEYLMWNKENGSTETDWKHLRLQILIQWLANWSFDYSLKLSYLQKFSVESTLCRKFVSWHLIVNCMEVTLTNMLMNITKPIYRKSCRWLNIIKRHFSVNCDPTSRAHIHTLSLSLKIEKAMTPHCACACSFVNLNFGVFRFQWIHFTRVHHLSSLYSIDWTKNSFLMRMSHI